MIELYLSKVTETSESEQAGKYYARVSYKQTMGDSATVASPRVAKPRWSLAVVRGIIFLSGESRFAHDDGCVQSRLWAHTGLGNLN